MARSRPGYVAELASLFASMARPSNVQLSITLAAGQHGCSLVGRAINGLRRRDPALLQRMGLMFGHHVSPEGIIAGLRLIRRRLERAVEDKTFLIDPNAQPGVLAYVFAPPSATMPGFSPFVMLAPAFFSQTATGRALTLIHECAHLALAIRDQPLSNGDTAYGLLNVIALAGENPTLAVRNADNWSTFVAGDQAEYL
jgi:hypothetical protein